MKKEPVKWNDIRVGDLVCGFADFYWKKNEEFIGFVTYRGGLIKKAIRITPTNYAVEGKPIYKESIIKIWRIIKNGKEKTD